MTYALIDGKLVHGTIRYGVGIGKLTGVPNGEPRYRERLDKPDPHTGWLFRFVTPMRPPTQEELDRFQKDTFEWEGGKAFTDEIEVLDTEDVICAQCEAWADGVKGDFLCVDCRYETSE